MEWLVSNVFGSDSWDDWGPCLQSFVTSSRLGKYSDDGRFSEQYKGASQWVRAFYIHCPISYLSNCARFVSFMAKARVIVGKQPPKCEDKREMWTNLWKLHLNGQVDSIIYIIIYIGGMLIKPHFTKIYKSWSDSFLKKNTFVIFQRISNY